MGEVDLVTVQNPVLERKGSYTKKIIRGLGVGGQMGLPIDK